MKTAHNLITIFFQSNIQIKAKEKSAPSHARLVPEKNAQTILVRPFIHEPKLIIFAPDLQMNSFPWNYSKN